MTWETLKYRKCRLSAYMSGAKISGTLRIIQFAFSLHARLNYRKLNVLALKVWIVFDEIRWNSLAKCELFDLVISGKLQADTDHNPSTIFNEARIKIGGKYDDSATFFWKLLSGISSAIDWQSTGERKPVGFANK